MTRNDTPSQDAVPLRQLSDWQLARVRDALRAYHRYERAADGTYFTWKDVREAIAEYTGHAIGGSGKNGPKLGAERLRQFVEGVESKDTPLTRKYPVPHPDALQAIVAFVTHEDLNLLSPAELEEEIPGPQAMLRLSGYFQANCDTQVSVPLAELVGAYEMVHPLLFGWSIHGLTLQHVSEDGTFLQAIDEMIYVDGDERPVPGQYLKGHREGMVYTKRTGWAICTPEDRLLVFLKHPPSGKNTSYYSLNDIGLFYKQAASNLYVLRHEHGYELDDIDAPDGRARLLQEAEKYINKFTRTSGERYGKWYTVNLAKMPSLSPRT